MINVIFDIISIDKTGNNVGETVDNIYCVALSPCGIFHGELSHGKLFMTRWPGSIVPFCSKYQKERTGESPIVTDVEIAWFRICIPILCNAYVLFLDPIQLKCKK